MNRFRLATIVVFFITLQTANAQFIRGYGLKAGLVSSNQYWQSPPDTPGYWWDNYTNFTASGFIEVLNMPVLSVVGELQYTHKGMREPTSYVVGQGDYKKLNRAPRVDYLSIPLMAKVRFRVSPVSLYLLAGPRLDVLLVTHYDGFRYQVGHFKDANLGATFGLGVQWHQFLGEFRYNHDFTDSYDGPYITVKNRSMDFVIGVEL